jgi:NAD(P)-dependent dehydrogenase (short-subunit alcohol dehydrogenase family)
VIDDGRKHPVSLFSRIGRKGANGFGYGSTAEAVTTGLSLAGKSILITGCNSGLGFESMRVLALRGAHVIGAARTLEKAESACRAVGGATTAIACELSDPASVVRCLETLTSAPSPILLDAIICNAGIMALPALTQAYGYELQFFTNHIGHFMLVNGLLNRLATDGRVVVLSSTAHHYAPKGGIQFDNLSGEKGYRPWMAYGQSKFANLLFAKELARRFSGTSRTANAVHPGVIHTNLGRNMRMASWVSAVVYGIGGALALKSIPEGAATECYVAVHPLAARSSGLYFSSCNPKKPRSDAEDPGLARRLWDTSEEIVAGLGRV